jgi:hypothetical protein
MYLRRVSQRDARLAHNVTRTRPSAPPLIERRSAPQLFNFVMNWWIKGSMFRLPGAGVANVAAGSVSKCLWPLQEH